TPGRSESFDIPTSGYRRVPGRAERIAVLGCGIVSIIVLIAVVAAEPRASAPPPRPSPTAIERGDPVLAAALADRARAATDDRDGLRLLVAASVVAPDRPEHRLALAGAVLGSVPPQRVNGGPLGDGAVRFGSVSAGGSWLVIDRDSGGQL